jgi:hypothetical protein
MSGFEKASAFQNPSFVIWGAIFHLPFAIWGPPIWGRPLKGLSREKTPLPAKKTVIFS